MSERRLTLLVHGDPGSGKSWLINSAPGPRLLLDAEGRAEYLADLSVDPEGMTPQKIVYWNPRNPIPEESADESVVTVVDVQEFKDLEMTYQWLQRGQHPFRSVGIDSLTEVQQRLIDAKAGTAKGTFDSWGEVLRELDRYVRNFRDLRKHPTNPLWAVVVVAGSKTKNDQDRPMLQGQLSDRVGFHFDVLGHMSKRKNAVTGERERVLLIDGYVEGVQAKDNTHVLSHHYGEEIINPDVSAMLRVLNPETDQTKKER